MSFDLGSLDLQITWNTFIEFEAFTRETDGDLNYFIEEWKEKMVRVQSAGCEYSELLLGLKLLEKVNLSSDAILPIISKLSLSYSNCDSFLAQVVTNLKEECDINGLSLDKNTDKNNQSRTNRLNHEISDELEIKSNLISCSHCPVKFFDAVSLSNHFQEFHPNEKRKNVFISKNDLKPDPGLLNCSKCDNNFHLKEDLENHLKDHGDAATLESVVQVWVGSLERSGENPKDDPLMPDEIKMEINSVIDFKSEIHNIQAENESSDHMTSNSSEKIRCDICPREFTTVSSLRMHMVSHKTSVDFTCYLCGKTHETKIALYSHIREHRKNKSTSEPHYGGRKFPCEICGQQVAHAQKDKHMIKHFRDPIKCKVCGKEFWSPSRLNIHMDNHKTTKDFMCSHCGMRFQKRKTLYAHKSYHHKKEKNKQGETQTEAVTEARPKSGTTNGQINTIDQSEVINKEGFNSTPNNDNIGLVPANKVHCKTCGKFIVKTSMSRHKKIHMKNIYKCWICQKEFNMAFYLKTHLETHKETKDHVCPYCGNAYKTKRFLRKHMNKFCRKKTASSDNNPQAEEKFTVEKVMKSISKDTINTETKEISGKNSSEIAGEFIEEVVKQKEIIDQSLSEVEGKIPCEICSKLITKQQMVNHIKVHRLSVQCQCEICGEVVQDRKMALHLKTHDHQRNYKCTICLKQFKTGAHLRQHLETHNATKEYICSICGKNYKTKMTLNEHINQHTKVKPLPCKFCNKIFFSYGSRTFHVRAHHTGEKPYKCDICDERFYISSRKVQHMRKHTGEKPFSCDECGKSFKEAGVLKKHMRTVHKGVKSSDI